MPSGLSTTEYFDAIFEDVGTQDSGALSPARVSISEGSVELVIGHADNIGDHLGHVPDPDDGLGAFFWQGGSGTSAYPFTKQRPTREEVLDTDGGVWIALLRVVARGRTGVALPMELGLYFDPGSTRSIVERWSISNVNADVEVTKARLYMLVL